MTQVVDVEGEPHLGRPETDRELEASLNLIGECADWILTLGRPVPRARPTAEGMLLQRAVIRRVSRRTVSRFNSDETGEKLAIHLVTYRVEVKGEEIDLRQAPTGPFADLPDPLRTVADQLPENSSGWLTCRMIADQLALARNPPGPLKQAVITPVTAPAPIPGTLPVTATVDFPQVP